MLSTIPQLSAVRSHPSLRKKNVHSRRSHNFARLQTAWAGQEALTKMRRIAASSQFRWTDSLSNRRLNLSNSCSTKVERASANMKQGKGERGMEALHAILRMFDAAQTHQGRSWGTSSPPGKVREIMSFYSEPPTATYNAEGPPEHFIIGS